MSQESWQQPSSLKDVLGPGCHPGICVQRVIPPSTGFMSRLLCRGLELEDVVIQAVFPMGAEVEHLQVKALVALLPVRLKILDVAGSVASIYTFDPQADGSPVSSPRQSHAGRLDSPRTAGQNVQKLWLIYRPGHYEIVYPAEGNEELDKL